MYAIVQTVELEDNKLIIVPDSWVYDDDAQPCCFYPRSISKIVKYVKDAVEPNEKDFVSYKIQILKDEIESYDLALLAKTRRKYHSNTESEIEYNKNSKANRGEIKKKRISEDFVHDLRNEFKGKKIKIEKGENKKQKSSSSTAVKLPKKAKSTNTKVKKESESIPSIPEELEENNIAPIDRQNSVNSNDENIHNLNRSYSLIQNDGLASPVPTRTEELYILQNNEEGIVHQNISNAFSTSHDVTVSCSCQEMLKNIDNKLNMILDALRSNGPEPALRNKNSDVTPISPIGDRITFLNLERELLPFYSNPSSASNELKLKRNNMVKYFSQKLNPNLKGALKNSLMKALFKLYFTKEFILQVGWTGHAGRLEIRGRNGHLSLFFDIINACVPGTYGAVKDTSTAVCIITRRNHEIVNRKKRQMKDANESPSDMDSQIEDI